METIQHSNIHVNGINMHVAQIPNTGPPVLFLHGFPELWYSWRHQMLHLSSLGYRTIAPDLRGYGDTDAPPSAAEYTVFHIIGDLVALLDSLGLKQVFLVAHDWGAVMAWYFCLLRPDRIKALVNMSVVFSPRNPVRKPIESMRHMFGSDYYICRFQFDWMPYRNVMQRLPEMCKTGIRSWRSQCFLIYWNVVEYHPVERVMRQFGFLQEVPAPFPVSRQVLTRLRKTIRKGRLETDWSVHHAAYVDNWNHRHDFVVEGVPTNQPTTHQTYNDWFHRHTILYIKDPRHVPGVVHTGFDDHGGTARFLVDGLGFIGQEAIRMRNMGPDHYYENFGGVQGMASQLIGSINHIDQPSYIHTNEPGLRPDNTIPQHAPRGRGRRGRQRTRVNLIHDDDEGEGTQQFRGPAANYVEGTSNFGGVCGGYLTCWRGNTRLAIRLSTFI